MKVLEGLFDKFDIISDYDDIALPIKNELLRILSSRQTAFWNDQSMAASQFGVPEVIFQNKNKNDTLVNYLEEVIPKIDKRIHSIKAKVEFKTDKIYIFCEIFLNIKHKREPVTFEMALGYV